MENNEMDFVATEAEVRDESTDQVSEDTCTIDTFDPDEIADEGGSLNLGLIGAAVGLGVAVGTGVAILRKKVKSGAVKQYFEDQKAHIQFEKDKRAKIKAINDRRNEEIKQVRAEKMETVSEVADDKPAEETVETKKTSKK